MSEVLHVCSDGLIQLVRLAAATSRLPLATASLVCVVTDNRYVVHDNQSRMQISTRETQTSLHVFISAGVYILIAAGALMMVVGFLGCCGAIKESPCMLGLVSGSRPLTGFF